MLRNCKVAIINEWTRNSFLVIPHYEDADGSHTAFFFKEGEWESIKVPQGEPIPEDLPFLRVHMNLATKLVDALIEHVKPSGPTATEQELKATKGHLEDMRALTFGKLEVEAPGKKEQRND